MPRLLALSGLAALGVSMPVAAQLQPASEGELRAALATCLKATRAGVVDAQIIAADGWKKAEVTRDGRPVGGADQLYARTDSHAVLLVPPPGAPKVCAVLARTAAPAPFAPLADAISEALQAQPTSKTEREYQWIRRPQAADLAATGTAEAPSLRIAVIPLAPAPVPAPVVPESK